MGLVYALIYIPIFLYVAAFLYETYASFVRLKGRDKRAYVDATWEITHTLLVFGIVMIVMFFSSVADKIAEVLFWPVMLAALAFCVRFACYIYIFLVRRQVTQISWVDWFFALSHIVAAVILLVAVARVSIYLFTAWPKANLSFVGAFIPGLLLVLAVCAVPVAMLYTKK